MLIGFNAPTAGPLSTADNLAKIVVGAEAMGFDYATFSDHVVIPTAIAAEYPYSASGEFPSGSRVILDFENRVVEVHEIAYE